MRVTVHHWAILLDFCEKNPQIITNKYAGGRAEHKKLWEQLVTMLNSLGYGEKSIDEWKKALTEWKSKTKSKAANLHKSPKTQTGGAPSSTQIGRLTDYEQRLLCLMGKTAAVDGNPTNLQQHDEVDRRETIENGAENTEGNECPATRYEFVSVSIDGNADMKEETTANPSTLKQLKTTTNVCRARPRSRKRKMMVNGNISAIRAAIDKLDKVVQSTENGIDDDEFDIFAKHVAIQLKQMPLYDAIICQEQIQTVIRQKRLELLSKQS